MGGDEGPSAREGAFLWGGGGGGGGGRGMGACLEAVVGGGGVDAAEEVRQEVPRHRIVPQRRVLQRLLEKKGGGATSTRMRGSHVAGMLSKIRREGDWPGTQRIRPMAPKGVAIFYTTTLATESGPS